VFSARRSALLPSCAYRWSEPAPRSFFAPNDADFAASFQSRQTNLADGLHALESQFLCQIIVSNMVLLHGRTLDYPIFDQRLTAPLDHTCEGWPAAREPANPRCNSARTKPAKIVGPRRSVPLIARAIIDARISPRMKSKAVFLAKNRLLATRTTASAA